MYFLVGFLADPLLSVQLSYSQIVQVIDSHYILIEIENIEMRFNAWKEMSDKYIFISDN